MLLRLRCWRAYDGFVRVFTTRGFISAPDPASNWVDFGQFQCALLGACVKVPPMTDDKPIVTMSGSSGPPDLDDVLHEDAVRSTLPILGGMSSVALLGLAMIAALTHLPAGAVVGLGVATALLGTLTLISWIWRHTLPMPEVIAVGMVLIPAGAGVLGLILSNDVTWSLAVLVALALVGYQRAVHAVGRCRRLHDLGRLAGRNRRSRPTGVAAGLAGSRSRRDRRWCDVSGEQAPHGRTPRRARCNSGAGFGARSVDRTGQP